MTLAIAAGTRLGAGRYELESRLGRGGAATVWLAQDSVLERPVAVKVLSEALADDPAWLARFRREARLVAGLQHQNLVSVYDFDADSEHPFLVLAYMPGGSLYERLDTGERPDPERLTRDLLTALAAIHTAGIIHRDVKPGNVLLAADGRACLTDFGIARPEDATSLTNTGHVPGTGRYMAPELWRGEPASEQTDLYAAGVLLAQFTGDSASPELERLIERLSAEDPALRPESASAALAELGPTGDEAPTHPTRAMTAAVAVPPDLEPEAAHAAAGEPPTPTDERAMQAPAYARPDPSYEPPFDSRPVPRSTSGSRRWVPIAALAAVVLVIGAVLALAFGGGGDDDDEPAQTNEPQAAAGDKQNQENGGGGGGGEPAPDPPGPATDDPPPDPVATSGDGFALNQQGKELLDAGQYEEAIPILQQAVDSYPDGSDELEYGFALFNLANALRLAGRPAEAIPLLEERLEIPNQTDIVQAELDAAEQDLAEQEGG